MPQLFLPVGDYRRTRYRFWHLVQELFVTHFTQQIYDWCQERGAKLTGHMVLEETLLVQIVQRRRDAALRVLPRAGMDWLGRHINPPTTPLQVASVAHQVGRKAILSETFALTGWNVSFEELKWMFDWQMVRGVTLLCQHLEGYSLRGIRKRDYPPSLFYQQPWWEKYRPFNDYVSRLGMLLAEGEVAFDVLVLHPQSSAWLCYDDAKNEDRGAERALLAVTDVLEAAHVPFHYGDERILRRHGQVDGAAPRRAAALFGGGGAADGHAGWKHALAAAACRQRRHADLGGPPANAGGRGVNERLAELCLHGTRVPTPADLPAALPPRRGQSR